jgi:hypothetical protein
LANARRAQTVCYSACYMAGRGATSLAGAKAALHAWSGTATSAGAKPVLISGDRRGDLAAWLTKMTLISQDEMIGNTPRNCSHAKSAATRQPQDRATELSHRAAR